MEKKSFLSQTVFFVGLAQRPTEAVGRAFKKTVWGKNL